jgi:hypothetical protein
LKHNLRAMLTLENEQLMLLLKSKNVVLR